MYTTTHDPVKETMTHTFENGYEIVVHWNIKKAYKSYNGVTDDFSIEGLSIKDYHNMLLKISNEVTPKCN